MTCMSMYKTTKIVPVKVVRLIDFSLPWSHRSLLLTASMYARSLAASFVSDDVRGAVLRESGTTLHHPIQYNVNSESR